MQSYILDCDMLSINSVNKYRSKDVHWNDLIFKRADWKFLCGEQYEKQITLWCWQYWWCQIAVAAGYISYPEYTYGKWIEQSLSIRKHNWLAVEPIIFLAIWEAQNFWSVVICEGGKPKIDADRDYNFTALTVVAQMPMMKSFARCLHRDDLIRRSPVMRQPLLQHVVLKNTTRVQRDRSQWLVCAT